MARKWSVRCQAIAQANQVYIYGRWMYMVLGLTNNIQVSQTGWKHIFSITPSKMWIAVDCLLTRAMYMCLIKKISGWILGILKMSTTICRSGSVSLTTWRLLLQLDENFVLLSSDYWPSSHLITNIPTCHDSTAVVPCAKLCSDYCVSMETKAKTKFLRSNCDGETVNEMVRCLCRTHSYNITIFLFLYMILIKSWNAMCLKGVNYRQHPCVGLICDLILSNWRNHIA